MKKKQKLLVSFLLAMFFIFAIKVPAKAYVSLNFKQSGCTADSISFTWNSQNETTYYSSYTYYTIVSGYTIYSEDGAYRVSVPGSATSATITNMPKNYSGKFIISYSYVNKYVYNSGNVYNYNYTGSSSTYGNTIPVTPTRKNFAVNSVLASTKKISVVASRNELQGCSTGVILELYKGSKKVGSYKFITTSNYIGIAANATYKYRIRYYVTNNYNNVTYYGGWSPCRYFCFPKVSSIAKSNSKGCKVTVYRVAGVSHYRIYISKTSSKSGFKACTTLKMGSAKKKTYSLKKNYAKKKTNYIKILPYIKGYGWSDVGVVYYQYIYK